MISRVKGTQDVLDMTLFNFIINQAQKHLQAHHFHEISTPILEPVELFKRALGTYTDVVTKEMYCFKSSEQEESEEICLRPEVTASTVRAFVENHIDQIPWKVFSWGPMFRRERPQKGRYRQFHQVSIEVIGSASISQDALFIKMLDRFFSDTLKLNNYAVQLNFLGCSEDRERYKEKLHAFLQKHNHEICGTCRERAEKNIMRVFDCKNEGCAQVYQNAPVITGHLCAACVQEWTQLQEQLALISVSYVPVPTLVRGLDYYHKTVFEFVSANLGAQNTFCGGGRYHQLVQYCGGKEDQPCVGAAMGIERLILLIEPLRNSLALAHERAIYAVIPTTTAQDTLGLLVADQLVGNGLAVDVLFDGSLKSRMRKAHKMGAAATILIGPDEQAKREVTIKNMQTGEEKRVAQIDLVEVL